MAESLAYLTTNITIGNGFVLDERVSGKDNEVVKIPFSDISFLRRMGKMPANIDASGLETFPTLAEAKTFRDEITGMEGEEVTVIHDRLTTGGGIVVECLSTGRASVQTNKTPGFHVIWSAEFRLFP